MGKIFCDPISECMDAATWDCGENDKIRSYADCAESISFSCSNYTFTAENFGQAEPVVVSNDLDQGAGCWMHINRTLDGSYGTLAIEYDNPFLFVFDEKELIYESGTSLGLIEEPTREGWQQRELFVANGGLMPTQFNAVFNGAAQLLGTTLLTLSCLLALN